MQRLRTRVPTRGWWLSGVLGGLGLLLIACVVLRLFHSPPATAQRQAPAARVTAGDFPTLTWNYAAAAPERFVVRRSLDGGTWQDVAVVPGASGTGLTWQDTTLPAPTGGMVVHYTVYAVTNKVWSEASNRAIATLGGAPRLPSAQVKVVGADSAKTAAAQHPAPLAGDGTPATFWHTTYSGTPAPLPHWITLDLGAVMAVDGLAYLPRQDTKRNGIIGEYDVAVSADNKAWSAPVAKGAWTWGPLRLEQYVRWPAVQARYVKLTARTEVSGGPWTSAAELGVYAGTQAPAPAGVVLGECVVTRPQEKVTVITCQQP